MGKIGGKKGLEGHLCSMQENTPIGKGNSLWGRNGAHDACGGGAGKLGRNSPARRGEELHKGFDVKAPDYALRARVKKKRGPLRQKD